MYYQPLQKAGRVQYQLLRALRRTHFSAAADGYTCFPSISTMGKGTSSSPATRGSKLFSPLTNMNGSYHVAKKQDVSPSTNVDGGYHGTKEQDVSPPANTDGGHHGTKEEGQEEKRATQLHNTVQLYSAAYHDQ